MVYLSVALALVSLVAIYFAARFFLLKRALVEANGELKEINADIIQNHVLRLPVPDKNLGALMSTVNSTLECIRRERVSYAARERAFRSQIEAISHDLRTPLTVIIGYVRILQSQNVCDEQTLSIILRKAQSMQKLISAFYEYSRVIAGDIALDPGIIDESRLMRETFLDNCVILEDKELAVYTDFAEYPVNIFADGDALGRIEVNILQNAARYAHSYFKIALKQEGDRAVAIFENDAEGLDEDKVARLFDKFYTADSSRSSGGTGLGLTIAANLAERMGGSLTAELAQGEGGVRAVRFTLSFPVAGKH